MSDIHVPLMLIVASSSVIYLYSPNVWSFRNEKLRKKLYHVGGILQIKIFNDARFCSLVSMSYCNKEHLMLLMQCCQS
jgi:hypothetical protein